MEVSEAIKKRRSIRKFKEKRITYETLKKLIDAGRIAPSAANLQPLEYLIVDDPELEKRVFENTEWANYIDWEPSFEERPRAYIFILIDEKNITDWYKYDVGLASENICLKALDEGLGACILAAINRDAITELLNVPENKRVDIAIALGVPDQEAKIDDSREGDVEYWIDDEENFHVPKRDLEDILHRNKFGH